MRRASGRESSWAVTIRGYGKGLRLWSPAELIVCGQRPAQADQHAYQVLRESFGPRGKVILDVNLPDSIGAVTG
jgi:hypothetical protein